MTEEALKAKRAYQRQWAKNNPEKVKATQERYWEKKAKEAGLSRKEEDKGKE